jgi:gliding motility-associated-like protein
MKRRSRYMVLLLVCMGCKPLLAQNLVRNNGFEEYTLNPSAIYLEDVVHHWYAYFSTPDYFSLDIMDTQQLTAYCGTIPHGGRGMAGSYQLGYFPDMPGYNREYIQGELTEPLKPNTLYYAEMYVKPMMKSPAISWAIGNLGMAFTHKHYNRIDSTDTFLIKEIPEVEYTGTAITDRSSWTKVSGCFKAEGGETKIIIGNFRNDAATDTALLPGAVHHPGDYTMSYYLFDDLLVKEMPAAYIYPAEALICKDSTIDLKAFPEGVQYAWNTGATANPLTVSKAGTYQVNIITAEGCVLSATADVSVKHCGPVCPPLYMPNAFSPNGDGLNDYFLPMNTEDITYITLSIYNRWGERVFQSNALKGRWDGTFNALPCDAGTYQYDVRYRDCHGEAKAKKGDIALVR